MSEREGYKLKDVPFVLARQEAKIADLEAELAAEREMVKELRLQLRNAWGRLECRCIFDDENNKTHEDNHCPYHGWYYGSGDDYWPIAAERERAESLKKRLVLMTERAEQAEAQLSTERERAEKAERERDEAKASAEMMSDVSEQFKLRSRQWKAEARRLGSTAVFGDELPDC